MLDSFCDFLFYAIHVFFLWIPDVKLSLARVASRVKMGGHGIPEKDVRRRFHRGLKNFFKFYHRVCDSWMIFDNSESIPCPIAKEETGKLIVFDAGRYASIVRLGEGK